MEIGEVFRITRPAFLVVGKEQQGPVMMADEWIPQLWEAVYEQLVDLQQVVEFEVDAQMELWGLMSDAEEWLAPWQEAGRYLAGMALPITFNRALIEHYDYWELPAMEYLMVKTDAPNLERITEQMFEKILPQEQATLVAAIQEQYLPEFEEDEVILCFPIRIIA